MKRYLAGAFLVLCLAACLPGPAPAAPEPGAETPAARENGPEQEGVEETGRLILEKLSRLGEELSALAGRIEALEKDRAGEELAALRGEVESLRGGLRALDRYLRQSRTEQDNAISALFAAERGERRRQSAEIMRMLQAIQLDVRTFGSGTRVPRIQ